MSEFYVGQIMLTGFSFAPRGFAACNGQLLPIAQNQALFTLLSTMYGGDGRINFALPDLRGRTPVYTGPSVDPSWQPSPYQQGAQQGAETVTLQVAQLPMHNHMASATTVAGTVRNPSNALYGGSGTEAIYSAATGGTPVTLVSQTLNSCGGGQSHPNMQPFQVLNFNIALTGIWPSRS